MASLSVQCECSVGIITECSMGGVTECSVVLLSVQLVGGITKYSVGVI